MLLLKNLGIKTAVILVGLLAIIAALVLLWKERLLPVEMTILFCCGSAVFFVLNIFDRKNQLKKLGDTLLSKGDDLYRKNEMKGAIRDYSKALELKGPNLKAYLGISQCYKALNEYKKSMEYAKMALELKSDSANALFLLGISLFRQDYPDSALKHLENATQISPDLSEGHFMIGEIHTALGRKEDAIKAYSKYIELCKEEKAVKAVREKITRLSGGT